MTGTWFGKSYHVHNAALVQFEPWGGPSNDTTLLRFRGMSCGHGYNSQEATITMNGFELALLKEKLGPRNITRFAPACVDCTVAQAKHFKFCPWCGESLK